MKIGFTLHINCVNLAGKENWDTTGMAIKFQKDGALIVAFQSFPFGKFCFAHDIKFSSTQSDAFYVVNPLIIIIIVNSIVNNY